MVMKLSLIHIFTNAIVHGCLSNEHKHVQLNLSYDAVNIYIEVIDHGVGIEDIDKAREPLFSTKLEEERAGLGFTIMEVFTDKLEVKSKPKMCIRDRATTIPKILSIGCQEVSLNKIKPMITAAVDMQSRCV